MTEEVVTLLDEDGHERRFRLHDAFEVEATAYYLVESIENAEEVLLLRESGEGLEAVTGEEFDRVLTALEEEAD